MIHPLAYVGFSRLFREVPRGTGGERDNYLLYVKELVNY